MYLFKINNKYTSTTSDVDLVSRSSRPKVFCKKVFLKIHICVEDSFLTDVPALRSATFLKEILQHTCVFSYELLKIFKNTIFYRTTPVVVFILLFKNTISAKIYFPDFF